MVQTENIYLQPLSLRDEIPRVSAQARLLYHAQQPFFASLDLPPAPGRFLDAGAGPGIFTHLLSKDLPGHEVSAFDLSEEIVTLGRLSYPGFDWQVADTCAMPYADKQFDLVLSSYVLIHLRDIPRAVGELTRVLSDRGLLYVISPNDRTFRGPQVLLDLVAKHAEVHPGNRYVMEDLEAVAKDAGLRLVDKTALIADNRGSDREPAFDYPRVSIGKMTAWAMLAYMGQRPEVGELYNHCQNLYMNNAVEFEAEIHAHVYARA